MNSFYSFPSDERLLTHYTFPYSASLGSPWTVLDIAYLKHRKSGLKCFINAMCYISRDLLYIEVFKYINKIRTELLVRNRSKLKQVRLKMTTFSSGKLSLSVLNYMQNN